MRRSIRPTWTGIGHNGTAFIWRDASGYHLIANDQRGKITGNRHAGVLAHSRDAVTWHLDEDPLSYVKQIQWSDGQEIEMGQLERPFGLIQDSRLTHLFFATMDGPAGFNNSTKSWNMVVPMEQDGD